MLPIVGIVIIGLGIVALLILWRARSRSERIEKETEPDVMDRVDIYDLHGSGGDFL
jgi:hypothetical protein